MVPSVGSPCAGAIEQPQGPGITHADFGAELCQQRIPSEVKEGGRALASRAVRRRCLQRCHAGAGAGTHCFWWPQVGSCLSTPCHLQAQRGCKAGKGPHKLAGRVGFALHLSLGPGMKIPGGRMGQDSAKWHCHQSLSWAPPETTAQLGWDTGRTQLAVLRDPPPFPTPLPPYPS